MGENNIKLTISILASNRKDTLPKCLDSLVPLINQVPSELIIVDTGCDDELLDIIKTYTNNIVKFKWCNDFAAARNAGLSMAKGQWFMFIDDDEWFEDVSELIAFFNGEDSKEYVSANYVVRNYKSLNGDDYSEGVVGRIYRMYEGIRFEGKVHECISKIPGKVKQLTSYAHHYGYVFNDDEKRKKHFERNTVLLIEEINNNPQDARNYAHIYQEYRLMNEPEIALEYAKRALEEVDMEYKGNKICLCSTYVCFVWAYTQLQDYENVVKWGEEFLDTKPVTGVTEASIRAYMANAYKKLKMYDKAIESADHYLRIRAHYKFDKIRYYKEIGPLLNDTFEEIQVGRAISAGLESAINKNDLEKVLYYMLSYDWSRKVYMVELKYIDDFVQMVAKYNIGDNKVVFKDCVRAFGKLFTNNEASKILLSNVTKIKEENLSGYTCLFNIMAQVAGQVGYKELADIIAANKADNIDRLIDLYIAVLSKGSLLFSMENEFYDIAIERKIPIASMIGCMEPLDWSDRIVNWVKKARNTEISYCKKYMDMFLSKESIYMKILEEEIVKELEIRKK